MHGLDLTSSSSTDGVGDASRSLLGVFVLPDADSQPSCFGEQSVGLGVSASVGGNLVGPVLGVGGRLSVMVRTPMRETPVEKDGDFCSGEDKVSGASYWLSGRVDTR